MERFSDVEKRTKYGYPGRRGYPAVGHRQVSCASEYLAKHDMSIHGCHGPVFITIVGIGFVGREL